MKKWGSVLQVSFTYVGTVVGAGFATGQEILQFFTRYGWMATLTIGVASALFVWLGIKLMLLAGQLNAKSYEDLNKLLFGPKIGEWVSLFTMVILFGVTTVMLAGAGSVFAEQLKLPYQAGLLFTMALTYLLLIKGMKSILAVNSLVVPMMALFSVTAVIYAYPSPGSSNWLLLDTGHSTLRIWLAPLLYAAFNLSMAQAVLVPLGAAIRDRSVLIRGGTLGGILIGLMLLAGHFALSAQMPDILRYDIPMGLLTQQMGGVLKLLFVFVIYSEIFTTFLADIYGLSLQISQRTGLAERTIVLLLLAASFAVSQIGFKVLLSSLYPLFGLLSMAWMTLLIWRKDPAAEA